MPARVRVRVRVRVRSSVRLGLRLRLRLGLGPRLRLGLGLRASVSARATDLGDHLAVCDAPHATGAEQRCGRGVQRCRMLPRLALISTTDELPVAEEHRLGTAILDVEELVVAAALHVRREE